MLCARASIVVLAALALIAMVSTWPLPVEPSAVNAAEYSVANAGDDGAHRSPGTPEATPINYFSFAPLAIRLTSATNPYFYIQTDGTVTSAYITLTNGSTVSLVNGSGGNFHVTLTHAQATYGYSATDYNHNFVGFLNIFQGAVKAGQYNLSSISWTTRSPPSRRTL